MENFTTFWQGQDKRRLAVLALATVAAFLLVFFLTRIATAPRMELLFARLEPATAAEVVASLEQRGVAFEVQGDSILVDGTMRDALRMQLAGEGLPRMDGTGYELLDGLSGFGTTSQMFDAAYWRAREGELTRTILSTPGLRMARVHLATADSSPFARDRSATASVTLQMTSGAVGTSLARAVQSLVAGAVRNLSPEDVTVIDGGTSRVVGGGAVDTQEEARDARMAEMRASVENLLAARVGPGRYVVELAVETRKDRETITERILDPSSRVVMSTDTEERTSSEQGSGGAGVTVASNLPDGDAAAGGDTSQSSDAETRERVNYDFSATQRQIEKAPGAIERLTVAVLVDGVRGADGADWTPRAEAELETLRDLVQSAVGFREDRGDLVTVRTMQFDVPGGADAEPGLSLPWFSGGQVAQMVTAALLALVALGVLAFVVRPLLARALAPALPSPVPSSGALASPEPPAAAAPRELASPRGQAALAAASDDRGSGDVAQLTSLLSSEGADGDAGNEDSVARLRQLISDRREETIEVLRGWMDEPAGGRPVSGGLLEDFGAPVRARAAGPAAPADDAPDRFDEGYSAGWGGAMAQAEADGIRVAEKLAERLGTLHRDQRAATATALRALEPALRDIFDRLLPRTAGRAFLPVLMEEVGQVLETGVRRVSLAVSPEDVPALTRLMERAEIGPERATVRAEPALSLSQAVIGWDGQERRVDLEGTLAALDDALETFLTTMDRGDDAGDADMKEAMNG